MEITKELEETIINFGAFDYDARKIANILDVDFETVNNAMQDKTSKLSLLIQKGKDMSDYAIDVKLFEMAQAGDIKAIETIKNRKIDRIFDKELE